VKPQNESPRAPAIQVFWGPLADRLRRELVYAGDLLVFKGVEPMAELCTLTDELIRETLGTLDPVRAQFELDREDYVTRVGELRKLYRRHGHAKRQFLAALGRVGVDLRRMCWDWLHLRGAAARRGRARSPDREALHSSRHLGIQHLRPDELVGPDLPNKREPYRRFLPQLLVPTRKKHQRRLGLGRDPGPKKAQCRARQTGGACGARAERACGPSLGAAGRCRTW